MSRRWRAVRKRVLERDLWRCQVVPGCREDANTCDHVIPVYSGMPDVEFYDESKLRASCKRHNTARGVAARLQRELNGELDVQRTPYSYGRRPARRAAVF